VSLEICIRTSYIRIREKNQSATACDGGGYVRNDAAPVKRTL
jgi:hypothetical protein